MTLVETRRGDPLDKILQKLTVRRLGVEVTNIRDKDAMFKVDSRTGERLYRRADVKVKAKIVRDRPDSSSS